MKTAPDQEGVAGSLLYFAHIPKCGGTSLRASLAAGFGRRRCVWLYQVHDRAAHKVYATAYRDLVLIGVDRAEAARMIVARCEDDGMKLLATHFNVAFKAAIPPERTFTILREPVARLISAYDHYKARGLPIADGTFRGFAMEKIHRNVQSRSLAPRPLQSLGAVGVIERYEHSVKAIGERFGVTLRPRRENVTKSAGALRRSDLPSDLIAEIEARHARDVRLYQRALAAFESRWV